MYDRHTKSVKRGLSRRVTIVECTGEAGTGSDASSDEVKSDRDSRAFGNQRIGVDVRVMANRGDQTKNRHRYNFSAAVFLVPRRGIHKLYLVAPPCTRWSIK